MVGMQGICNRNPETTVWCHSNQSAHGKGERIKAHDCFGFLGCSSCHFAIDQGRELTRYQRETWTQDAMTRSRWYLIDQRLIVGATFEVARDDGLWLAGWQDGTIKVARDVRRI